MLNTHSKYDNVHKNSMNYALKNTNNCVFISKYYMLWSDHTTVMANNGVI